MNQIRLRKTWTLKSIQQNATKATVIVEPICTFLMKMFPLWHAHWCVLHSFSSTPPLTERWCEDSDALYTFVTRISPSTHGRRYLKGSKWKGLKNLIGLRIYRSWAVSNSSSLSKRLLYLGTIASSRHWSPWALRSSGRGWREGKTHFPPAENTCRHANTTWEGAIGGLAFMSTVTNPQV